MTSKSLLPSIGFLSAALALCVFATGCTKNDEKNTDSRETENQKVSDDAGAKPSARPKSETAPKPETKSEEKSGSKPADAAADAGSASGSGFDKTLSLEGISFRVQCANEGSLNDLTITPKGLENGDSPVTIKDIDGSVVGAEIADLNGDGSPEIYIYTQSAGSGSYGNLIAYSVNKRKSMTPIHLPELDGKLSKGYMGHDEFAIVETVLARRFPIYKAGDSNAKPTGGMRQVSYKLKAGEAGWLLVVDQVNEF